MDWVYYITALLLLFVLPARVYSAGYILSVYESVADEDFTFFQDKSKVQDMETVKVFLYVYENNLSKQCMQVVSFNLMETEDLIDFIMVSCDLKGPFTKNNEIINVANVGYFGAKKNYPMWAVYVLPAGRCVQRIYTDKYWSFLGEVEEMDLTMQQCRRVIENGRPLKAEGSKEDDVTSIAQKKLPTIGKTRTKVTSLDDTSVEDFKRNEGELQDREAMGQFVKLTVFPLINYQTGECARFVSINAIETEDFLDSVVVSCDGKDNDELVIVDDMIAFAGLLYVRDRIDEPIWAVFAKVNHCILRVYTNKEHTALQPKNQKRLEWDDCLNLLEDKNIEGRWNREENNPSPIIVSKTYEEAVNMLQETVNIGSPSEDSNVDQKYVKPEGPGFQAVPQPAPPAPLEQQMCNVGTDQFRNPAPNPSAATKTVVYMQQSSALLVGGFLGAARNFGLIRKADP